MTNLSPKCQAYATVLEQAGFTVYYPTGWTHWQQPFGFFHYSREVDGQTCYGIFDDGSSGFNGPSHTMPIRPSRLNGSAAVIGGLWGDEPTLGIDTMDPLSVEYAMAVARPFNWCPFNAEPTPEALDAALRASRNYRGVPKIYYQGARLANYKPDGVGTLYVGTITKGGEAHDPR